MTASNQIPPGRQAAPASTLTSDQAQRIERARAVLAEPNSYEPADMAGRIGALEWHLEELLSLAGELSQAAAGRGAPSRRTSAS